MDNVILIVEILVSASLMALFIELFLAFFSPSRYASRKRGIDD